MSDISQVVNFFPTTQEGFVSSTSAQVIGNAATIVPMNTLAGYADGAVVVFIIDPSVALKKQVFTGTVDLTNLRIINVKWTEGTPSTHLSGAVVMDYVTSTDMNMVTTGIQKAQNQDGSLRRTVKKVISVTSAASYTINADLTDSYVVTGLATNTTFNAPTGSPIQTQGLLIRIKDNGVARTITWDAIFRAMSSALPVSTVISKTLYVGFLYNSTDGKWDLVAVTQEV